MTPPDAGRVEEIRQRHTKDDGKSLCATGRVEEELLHLFVRAHADRAILLAALTPAPAQGVIPTCSHCGAALWNSTTPPPTEPGCTICGKPKDDPLHKAPHGNHIARPPTEPEGELVEARKVVERWWQIHYGHEVWPADEGDIAPLVTEIAAALTRARGK